MFLTIIRPVRAVCTHEIRFIGSRPVYSRKPMVRMGSSWMNLRTLFSPISPPGSASSTSEPTLFGSTTTSRMTSAARLRSLRPRKSPPASDAPRTSCLPRAGSEKAVRRVSRWRGVR